MVDQHKERIKQESKKDQKSKFIWSHKEQLLRKKRIGRRCVTMNWFKTIQILTRGKISRMDDEWNNYPDKKRFKFPKQLSTNNMFTNDMENPDYR